MTFADTSELDPLDANNSTTITSLKNYRRLVDQCAAERLDFEIANGSAKHARILIGKLFEIATREVLIISGSLQLISDDGVPIYSDADIIQHCKGVLRATGTTMKIILQSGDIDHGKENTFLKEVIGGANRKGVVSIVSLGPEMRDSSIPHMMITDGEAYRFETSTDAVQDHHSIKAVANFGAPRVADRLHAYFEELFATVQNRGMGSNTVFGAGARY